MDKRDARPTIIVAPGPQSPLIGGQCDACPAALTASWQTETASVPRTGRFVSLPLRIVELEGQYSAVHAAHLKRRPIVLNRAALDLVRHFQAASRLSEIPAAWADAWGAGWVQETLARMIDLRLLVSEEVAESVGS